MSKHLVTNKICYRLSFPPLLFFSSFHFTFLFVIILLLQSFCFLFSTCTFQRFFLFFFALPFINHFLTVLLHALLLSPFLFLSLFHYTFLKWLSFKNARKIGNVYAEAERTSISQSWEWFQKTAAKHKNAWSKSWIKRCIDVTCRNVEWPRSEVFVLTWNTFSTAFNNFMHIKKMAKYILKILRYSHRKIIKEQLVISQNYA